MRKATLQGGCACGKIRYGLTAGPLIVHACHCRDCQRITGSTFVINIWIESKFVETDAAFKSFRLKGGSGNPHDVFFCDKCRTSVWSRYHGAPGNFLLVRAGTLDNPEAFGPTFTSSREANCRGCNFLNARRHSQPSTRSTKSGHPRARNG